MFNRLPSTVQLGLLSAVVLISRLPFLDAGYGVEEDSWGIAVAMHNTVTTGIPEASRLPGHPVHEIVLAALWSAGARWWIFNFMSALAGAVSAMLFSLVLKKLGFKHYILCGLVFAFIPVVYIAGTYTIDYMWTIAFVLASYHALLNKRLILSGILLGLAIGCRLTSIAMLLPFAIQLWENHTFNTWFKKISRVGITAFFTTVICYIPVIMVYGPGFFTYSDQFPYPPISKIFYKGSIGVFGLTGLVAIAVFTIILVFKRGKKDVLYAIPLAGIYNYVWLSTIIIYIIAYLGLPQKSAYMIPLVPFVLLIFTRHLNSVQFHLFSLCIVISPFILSINLTDPFRGAKYSSLAFKTTVSGQEIFLDPLTGPVFSDYTKRKQKMQFTGEVRERANRLTKRSVIISGWWYNMIIAELIDNPGSDKVIYTFFSNEEELRRYKQQGYDIYYLPEQDIYNDLNFKMIVTNKLAQPFITYNSD